MENNNLVNIDDKELMAQLSSDAEEYGHEAAPDDLLQSEIKLMQAISNQVNKKHEDYIEGAEVGDIVDIVSGKNYKEEINIIPITYMMNYNLVKGKGKDIEVVESYGNNSSKYDTAKVDENYRRLGEEVGTFYTKTYNWYVLVVDLETKEFSPALIRMSRSKETVARKLNTLASQKKVDGKTLPIFAGIYKLTSIVTTGKEGDYFIYRVSNAGLTISELGIDVYNAAKKLFKSSKDTLSSVKEDEEDII